MAQMQEDLLAAFPDAALSGYLDDLTVVVPNRLVGPVHPSANPAGAISSVGTM